MDDIPAIDRLIQIMAALRAPETGCPWDIQQTFASIAPYTIEEAYEVADAIERSDLDDLKDELGDLLLQVVFHARMAEEESRFSFNDVADAICQKMIRRHPHVFGDISADTAGAVKVNWEAIKAQEKAERDKARGIDLEESGILDGVAHALPALMRAEKLQKRAARVGFDWPDKEPVFDKLDEEVDEFKTAAALGDRASIEDELGDILFTVVNLARKHHVDPEVALRNANTKFFNRFKDMETQAQHHGEELSELSLETLSNFWIAAKSRES